MKINLNTLSKPILIDQEFLIPPKYYENTAVKGIQKVKAQGKIFYNLSDEIEISLKVTGQMILNDSITLEEIIYPFALEIDDIIPENTENLAENYKIDQNVLDIIELLWENIVLEVPISLTKASNLKLSGEGWTLNGNKEKEDSPFNDLNNLFKGGE